MLPEPNSSSGSNGKQSIELAARATRSRTTLALGLVLPARLPALDSGEMCPTLLGRGARILLRAHCYVSFLTLLRLGLRIIRFPHQSQNEIVSSSDILDPTPTVLFQ